MSGLSTTVTDTGGLLSAIASAQSGDTILMAAGSYSELRLDGVNIAGNVTITSQDLSHPASIAGLYITASSGLSFNNVEVTMDARTGYAVTLGGVSHLNFDHMNVHGAVVGDGDGFLVRNSDNVTITNSNIHDLADGIVHLNSSQLTFSGNTIHAIQTDGVHGGGSSNVTVSANSFTDFHPLDGQHPDAIQFFTEGTVGQTHDLTITNNVFVRGPGAPVQGIFVGSETTVPYENVTISGNAIIGGMYQGIAVGYADHATITNNLVEGYTDMTSWVLIQNSTNSSVTNNVATDYQLSNNNLGLTLSGDSQIAQGVIGDASALQSWQVSPTGVAVPKLDVIVPSVPKPDVIVPIVPTMPAVDGLAVFDMTEAQIQESISHNLMKGLFAGGWAL